MNQCHLKRNDKYKKYKFQYFKLNRHVHFVWFLKFKLYLLLNVSASGFATVRTLLPIALRFAPYFCSFLRSL